MKRSVPSVFPHLLPWIASIPFVILGLVCQFVLVGYTFTALVCICILGVIWCYYFLWLWKRRAPRAARTVTVLFTVLLCIGLVILGVTEGLIIHASFGNPEQDCEYMVVLGAKVRGLVPSLSLQNRIDAAYDYMTRHPDVIAVLSGGQGPDEEMTEARCMFDELTAMGIPAQRLRMEDRATSTWENLHFSLDLLEQETGTRPGKIGVLSSEYHLFRASLFTRQAGAEFIGIPATTTKVSLRINYFMREVAGVWHYILLGGHYHA